MTDPELAEFLDYISAGPAAKASLDPFEAAEFARSRVAEGIQVVRTIKGWDPREFQRGEALITEGIGAAPTYEVADELLTEVGYMHIVHREDGLYDQVNERFSDHPEARARAAKRRRAIERRASLDRIKANGIDDLPGFDLTTAFDDGPSNDWLLEPLLIRGGLTQLSSTPGEGKSLLAFDIAMSLANADRHVLGVKPERPARVLVVDFENDVHRDIGRWLRNLGYGPDAAYFTNIRYVTMPTVEALNTHRGGLALLATALEHDADLVVIDTLSRSIDGDENDASTFLNWYRFCGMPLKREGIACLRLDHLGKSSDKGARGSSAKMGDIDLAWEMRKSDAGTYRLVCTKNRMPLSEMHLAVNRVPEVWSGDELISPLRHDVEVHLTEHEARVRAVLTSLDEAKVPRDASVRTVKAMKDELGITASNKVIEDAVGRRKTDIGEDQ